MHHLLAAATVVSSPTFDAIKFAAAAAAFVLGLMRLLDTARPLWSVGGILPQKLQPIAIALVGVLPDLVTGFQHVGNWQDLSNVILAAAVGFFTSMRGQLPDSHLAALPADVHEKLAKVQKRKSIKVKPAMLVGMTFLLMFGSPFVLTDCAGLGANIAAIAAKSALLAADAESALSAAQSIADAFYKLAPAPEKEADVDATISAARDALADTNAAVQAAAGDAAKIEKAWDGFRTAYKKVQKIFQDYGVGANPHARAASLREPLAMKPGAAQ